MMRRASAASLSAAGAAFEPVVRSAGADALLLAQQLDQVAGALTSSAPLRRALADPDGNPSGKTMIVRHLLAGADEPVVAAVESLAAAKWSHDDDLTAAVRQLAAQAIISEAALHGDLSGARPATLLAAAQKRIAALTTPVAAITSAVALKATQAERLQALLERAYGPIQMRLKVDSTILGGLRIQVGADTIDSTMLTRLADARRSLAV
ncbi:MAG: F0F1 ATP synthase subunit delta [Promicromonosporaceae bacterium]|nr:F0F1 ATP synthase subunit delta [Promicromonosporaceae bacterium]